MPNDATKLAAKLRRKLDEVHEPGHTGKSILYNLNRKKRKRPKTAADTALEIKVKDVMKNCKQMEAQGLLVVSGLRSPIVNSYRRKYPNLPRQ